MKYCLDDKDAEGYNCKISDSRIKTNNSDLKYKNK